MPEITRKSSQLVLRNFCVYKAVPMLVFEIVLACLPSMLLILIAKIQIPQVNNPRSAT